MDTHSKSPSEDQDVIDLSDPKNEIGAVSIGLKPHEFKELDAFLKKFPADWTWDRIKRTILIGWRQGLYPATDAEYWLVICGFIKFARRENLDTWMEVYAQHEIGAAGLPEDMHST